jgi:excisionase family DNA binding protein
MTDELRERLSSIETLLREIKTQSRKVFDLRAAANYLGLSVDSMYRLTGAKRITFYKPNNKKIYFKRQDLDAYALRRRRSAE